VIGDLAGSGGGEAGSGGDVVGARGDVAGSGGGVAGSPDDGWGDAVDGRTARPGAAAFDPWGRVIGQPAAVTALRAALASDAVAHAWLLVGPRHVGQEELARALGGALNCPQATAADAGCGRGGTLRRGPARRRPGRPPCWAARNRRGCEPKTRIPLDFEPQ